MAKGKNDAAKLKGVFEKNPGSGVWWIRYADATGKIRRECAGSKSVARDLYFKRKAEIRDGKKLPDNLRARKVLFGELADDALCYVEAHNEGYTVDVIRIEQFKKAFGDRPADIPIEELRDWFSAHEWAAGTYNRSRTVLSSIYRLGIENKKISSNPAKLLKRKREADGRVRFLNQHAPDEEERLRAIIMSNFPEHLPEFDVALHTGMRRSEQYRRISWDCVDFQRRDLFVPKSKNGRARHISLNDAALNAFRTLHARPNNQGIIFASERGRKALQGPRHWFEDAVRKAGIKNFTWHDCRHTFASRLVMRGVPLRAVAELMGHQTIQMTMRYAHLSSADKLDAVKMLDTFTKTDTKLTPISEGWNIQKPTDTKTDTKQYQPVDEMKLSLAK